MNKINENMDSEKYYKVTQYGQVGYLYGLYLCKQDTLNDIISRCEKDSETNEIVCDEIDKSLFEKAKIKSIVGYGMDEEDRLSEMTNRSDEEQMESAAGKEGSKFFLEYNGVREFYFNRDAESGGQLVDNLYSLTDINELNRIGMSDEQFFDALQSVCTQYLTDRGSNSYDDSLLDFVTGCKTLCSNQLKEYQAEDFFELRKMIAKDTNWLNQYHTSLGSDRGDFQCEQSGGAPVVLKWDDEKTNTAWLVPAGIMYGGNQKSFDETVLKCMEWGVKSCKSMTEYNKLLEQLGSDVLESCGYSDEDITFYDDESEMEM